MTDDNVIYSPEAQSTGSNYVDNNSSSDEFEIGNDAPYANEHQSESFESEEIDDDLCDYRKVRVILILVLDT